MASTADGDPVVLPGCSWCSLSWCGAKSSYLRLPERLSGSFIAEFAIRALLAPDRSTFLKKN